MDRRITASTQATASLAASSRDRTDGGIGLLFGDRLLVIRAGAQHRLTGQWPNCFGGPTFGEEVAAVEDGVIRLRGGAPRAIVATSSLNFGAWRWSNSPARSRPSGTSCMDRVGPMQLYLRIHRVPAADRPSPTPTISVIPELSARPSPAALSTPISRTRPSTSVRSSSSWLR